MSESFKPKAPKVKPATLWIGGALVGGGIFWWAMHKRAATAAAASATTATDPNATDPNATGYDYSGSGGYGDYSAASGVSPSLYGYTDPATGAMITGVGNVITQPSTSAQWVQQASAYLVNVGYSPMLVASALGKYVLGLGLTNTEMGVVQSAIGAEGYPPGNISAPHVNPPSGQPGTPIPSGGLKAPHLIGEVNGTVGMLTWTPVVGAKAYAVHEGVNKRFLYSVTGTTTHVARHSGPYYVLAYNGSVRSPFSNGVSVK